MADVLELARQRRVEIANELKALDWFLSKAEELVKEVGVHSPTQTISDPAKRSATIAPAVKTVKVSAPQEDQAIEVDKAPVDTIVFKKMFSEMRRTHQQSAVYDSEQVAAAG